MYGTEATTTTAGIPTAIPIAGGLFPEIFQLENSRLSGKTFRLGMARLPAMPKLTGPKCFHAPDAAGAQDGGPQFRPLARSGSGGVLIQQFLVTSW